jgi:SCA7, zinc-binding domain
MCVLHVLSACLGMDFTQTYRQSQRLPSLTFIPHVAFRFLSLRFILWWKWNWEISLGCHVRRRSHYVHEKISAVGGGSQSLNAHKVSCCGSKCKSTRRRNVYPEAHGGHPARSLLDPHRLVNRNVQDQGNDSRANTPLAQHPFRIRQCGVPTGLRCSSRITCRNHRIENL